MQNLDQELLHRFTLEAAPMMIDTNPFARSLAAHLLRVNREAGLVELSYEPHPNFQQGLGAIQGGIVCAMLDFAMAFAVLARLPVGESATTVNINVSYLRAVQQGRLLGTGTVDRIGKTMAFTRAHLVAPEGMLLATATSTLIVLRP
jgi:uncharacterized protein (TIGR00369 family)